MIGLIIELGLGYSKQDWDDILMESENIDTSNLSEQELRPIIENAFEYGNLTNYVKSVYPDYCDMPYYRIGYEIAGTDEKYLTEVWNNENNN